MRRDGHLFATHLISWLLMAIKLRKITEAKADKERLRKKNLGFYKQNLKLRKITEDYGRLRKRYGSKNVEKALVL